MQPDAPATPPPPARVKGPLRSTLQVILAALLTGLLLFLTAGTLNWWNGWMFLALYVATVIGVSFFVFPRTPDLEAERKTAARHAPRWDRLLVPLLALLPIVAIVVAALDRRWGWTPPLPAVLSLAAGAGVLAGNSLTLWAMRSNPFFSSHVRIQSDRGHRLVHQGPYAWVRHPGYAGGLLFVLATPLALGSLAALVPAVLAVGVYGVRTSLEDRFLQRELPGYAEWSATVRFRLVPGLW